MVQIKHKLQQAHKNYAYELLQLQMAVQDEKANPNPSITQITKLIQLYMIGVQVLESIADARFVYFHNRIHALMLKKHIVKTLNEVSGAGHASEVPSKAELRGKKDEYQINCYFNQGQVDMKKVKEMLSFAETRQMEVESKINSDIKRQQDKLSERIKERRMRSEAGSVKKFKINDNVDTPSPNRKLVPAKDPRMEYFDPAEQYMEILSKNSNKLGRLGSGSLEKILFGKSAAQSKTPTVDKRYDNDAI